MSAANLSGSTLAARQSMPAAAWPAGRWIAATALILLLTAAMRALFHTDGDVAWLLVAAGRMLDGAVPYRDIVEPNPPASILLYVPAVLLGRLTGLRPDVATDLLVTAGLTGCLAGAIGILRRARLLAGSEALTFWCMSLPILLLMPLASFSQRDHVAAGAILPVLACLAARLRGSRPGWAAIGIAGIAAGITIAIKPFFALGFVLPLAALALQRRSATVLVRLPEMWIAAALAAAYGAAVLVLMPDYAARMLPLVVGIYLPAHNSWLVLLVLPTVWVWIACVATFWLQDRRDDPFGFVLALASGGLILCFFLQAKGFAYHGIPALVTAGLACASGSVRFLARGGWGALLLTRIPAILAALAGLNEFAWQVTAAQTSPGLAQALAAMPRPRMLTIGNDSEIGPVLAGETGAVWIGSEPITWITLYASIITPRFEDDPRFQAPIAAERNRYADDIARERPDVVLVEGEAWLAWARRSPRLASALAGFDPVGRYGKVILLRKNRLDIDQPLALRPALADEPPGSDP